MSAVWGRSADAAAALARAHGATAYPGTVSQHGGEAASGFETYLWGPSGRSAVPAGNSDALLPLRTALGELTSNIRAGVSAHPCDAAFGRDVGHVISEAQRQIDVRAA